VTADRAGRIPLHYAALEGDLAAVQAELDAGADVGAPDRAGYTPLHFASQSAAASVVERLIERGAPLESEDAHGNTPLWTATFNDKVGECVRVLLDAGANPDHVNRAGTTPRGLAETMGSPALPLFGGK
jgi:ankyrin repeat protein